MTYTGYADSSTPENVGISDRKDLKARDSSTNSSAALSVATRGLIEPLEKASAVSDVFGVVGGGLEIALLNQGLHMGRGTLAVRERSRSHSPPLNRAPVLQPQSQLLHRKRRSRANGSISGKENLIRERSHKAQAGHGKTKWQPRRAVLDDVTNLYQYTAANHRDDDSFANSTAVNTPRKTNQTGRSPTPYGLMFGLDEKPPIDAHQHAITSQDIDEDHCLVYRTSDEFLPQVVSTPPRKGNIETAIGSGLLSSGPVTRVHAKAPTPTITTPLRQALATFGDIFSPSPTLKAKWRGGVINNEDNTNRSSYRLPSPSLAIMNSPLKNLKISDLTGSITQFTGELAASLVPHCNNENHWGQSQYEEDAVARDERFDWEEEMRSLEIQYGVLS